jgi:hypothetical protein
MAVEFDKTMHHVRLECDGPATPMHCAIAIDAIKPTRNECIQYFYLCGWRIFGERALCPACLKRERERVSA